MAGHKNGGRQMLNYYSRYFLLVAESSGNISGKLTPEQILMYTQFFLILHNPTSRGEKRFVKPPRILIIGAIYQTSNGVKVGCAVSEERVTCPRVV